MLAASDAFSVGSDEERTCWRIASARMMPVVACATVGLFFTARSIACWNVNRSIVCARAELAATSKIATPTKPRRPFGKHEAHEAKRCFRERLCTAHTLFDGRGSGTTATQSLNHHIQDRDEQDVEERREQHPARHGGADGMAAFLPCTRREHQRHDAEDEGERGHENRPQPDARSLDGGVNHR